MIEEITSDDTLREWITAFVNDRIEDGRKWDIRGELLNLGGELFKEEYKRGRNGWDKGKEHSAKSSPKRRHRPHGQNMPSWPLPAGYSTWHRKRPRHKRLQQRSDGPAGYAAKIASGEITPYGKRVTDTIANGRWCTAKSPKKTQIEAIAPQLTELLAELAEAYDTQHPAYQQSPPCSKRTTATSHCWATCRPRSPKCRKRRTSFTSPK